MIGKGMPLKWQAGYWEVSIHLGTHHFQNQVLPRPEIRSCKAFMTVARPSLMNPDRNYRCTRDFLGPRIPTSKFFRLMLKHDSTDIIPRNMDTLIMSNTGFYRTNTLLLCKILVQLQYNNLLLFVFGEFYFLWMWTMESKICTPMLDSGHANDN